MNERHLTAEQRAAINAYWAAETRDELRAACAQVVAAGLPDPMRDPQEAELAQLRRIAETLLEPVQKTESRRLDLVPEAAHRKFQRAWAMAYAWKTSR